MELKLPTSLTNEPLVDAVFEVRLNGNPLLADILPGFLFHDLEPKPKMIRLPAAEIPSPMRAADPNLQFAPVLRLEWGQYFISVGDRNIVVSCKLPYPKWPSFKNAIIDIMTRVKRVGIEGQVERYSLKYVNLIQGNTPAEQIAKINISILLGTDEVLSDQLSLQVHRNEDDILHILSIIIGVEGQLPDGSRVEGAVVDIDSIRIIKPQEFGFFIENLESGLEQLRQSNKSKFFGCLKPAAINEMGPIYE